MPMRTGRLEGVPPLAAWRMASAARHAARGWSSRLSSAPKPDRMPSPLTSITVPPCSRTAVAMALIMGLMRSTADSASTALIAWVEPLRSANSTVAILRVAWLLARAGASDASGAPHSLQNLAPCGPNHPQRAQCDPCFADISPVPFARQRYTRLLPGASPYSSLKAKLRVDYNRDRVRR